MGAPFVGSLGSQGHGVSGSMLSRGVPPPPSCEWDACSVRMTPGGGELQRRVDQNLYLTDELVYW